MASREQTQLYCCRLFVSYFFACAFSFCFTDLLFVYYGYRFSVSMDIFGVSLCVYVRASCVLFFSLPIYLFFKEAGLWNWVDLTILIL